MYKPLKRKYINRIKQLRDEDVCVGLREAAEIVNKEYEERGESIHEEDEEKTQ